MQQDNIITNIIDHLRSATIQSSDRKATEKECRALVTKTIEIYAEYKSMEFTMADEALEREFLDAVGEFCFRNQIELKAEKILHAFMRGLSRRG